jgi:formylglycine-generating enzyme
MGGFYVDVLPWPNEVGAIPTTNVTREEAQRLCATRGKRLCTELEWERACKGPDSARYEYGANYDPRVCGTGIAAETTSRRPSGERPACRSAFGARDMHGGPWEWTDSSWGRGTTKDRAVARGGGDASGELTSRCAYAVQLSSDEHSPVVGFRCCAGPRNEAHVQLPVKTGPFLERTTHPSASPPLDALGSISCGPPSAPAPCTVARAWTWRPVPNVELSLGGGCAGRTPAEVKCALAISRALHDRIDVASEVATGWATPDIVFADPAERRIRIRGGEARGGAFFRDVVYSYGRVEVRPVH